MAGRTLSRPLSKLRGLRQGSGPVTRAAAAAGGREPRQDEAAGRSQDVVPWKLARNGTVAALRAASHLGSSPFPKRKETKSGVCRFGGGGSSGACLSRRDALVPALQLRRQSKPRAAGSSKPDSGAVDWTATAVSSLPPEGCQTQAHATRRPPRLSACSPSLGPTLD